MAVKSIKSGPGKFQEAFSALRQILAGNSKDLVAKFDTPDNYYVETRAALWKGNPVFFAAVQTKKNYVSFHLMPVYMCPDLLKSISPELKKRMQGKACFNFREPNDQLFAELETLVVASRAKWTSSEFFRRLEKETARKKAERKKG